MPDEKLVRDRIPEIAPERTYRVASPAEMPRLLLDKLREEAAELLATERGSADEIAEAADMCSVMYSLLWRSSGVDDARRMKDVTRGTFRSRVVLVMEESDAR